jgi:hypothetical protein
MKALSEDKLMQQMRRDGLGDFLRAALDMKAETS